MIYTSYYNNLAVIDAIAIGALPVRISWGTPRFKITYRERLVVAPEIIPEREMAWMDPDTYKKFYFDILEEETVDAIRARFLGFGATDLILLCFCKPSAPFCHRRLFADWWMDKTGEIIPEL
jgi:hypothetical protein